MFSPILEQLAPIHGAARGVMITAELAPSMGDSPGSIPNRLARRDPADVVVMVQPDLRRLEAEGNVLSGSIVELATSSIAMAVPSGAAVPDIGTEDGLRLAMLAAVSIAVSESASGIYVRGELLDRLGIRNQVAGKVQVVKGRPIGEAVVGGEFDIGFQQMAELMPVAGVQIAGLLPDSVQRETVVAAAIGAFARHVPDARSLMAFLASPSLRVLLRRNGLQSPHARSGHLGAAEGSALRRISHKKAK